jgi:chaperone modulatory protein CbpM
MKQHTLTAVIVDENTTWTFHEVCQKCHLSEVSLLDFLEHGLIEVTSAERFEVMEFTQRHLSRIQSAQRLQHDLGVNVPGVVLALELLEELQSVRHELDILRRHVDLEGIV